MPTKRNNLSKNPFLRKVAKIVLISVVFKKSKDPRIFSINLNFLSKANSNIANII